MAFHEVRFPDAISRGARGGPERRTQVVELTSGDEERNASWANSRRRYDVAYGIRRADDLAAVVAFFEARNGRLHGFRFKDWGDYKSCLPSQAPTPLDQVIGTGDGVSRQFLLVKHYASGAQSWTREIRKPVASSTRIALDGAEMETGWSVDALSGLVTFDAAPAAGMEITAGFEFDVPVRFDTDMLDVTLDIERLGSIVSIPLIELRLPPPELLPDPDIFTWEDVFADHSAWSGGEDWTGWGISDQQPAEAPLEFFLRHVLPALQPDGAHILLQSPTGALHLRGRLQPPPRSVLTNWTLDLADTRVERGKSGTFWGQIHLWGEVIEAPLAASPIIGVDAFVGETELTLSDNAAAAEFLAVAGPGSIAMVRTNKTAPNYHPPESREVIYITAITDRTLTLARPLSIDVPIENPPLPGEENDFSTVTLLQGTLLAADAEEGATEITMIDATGIAPGDWVYLSTAEIPTPDGNQFAATLGMLLDPSQPFGDILINEEIHCVTAVSGNVLTLAEPLGKNKLVAWNAACVKIDPIEAATIRGGRFVGQEEHGGANAWEHQYLWARYCVGCTISDAQFDTDPARGPAQRRIGQAVRCDTGAANLITGLTIGQGGSVLAGEGYGVSLRRGERNTIVSHSDIEKCRHSVELWSTTAGCIVEHNIVRDDSSSSLDTHGSWNKGVIIRHNTISNDGLLLSPDLGGMPDAIRIGNNRFWLDEDIQVLDNIVTGYRGTAVSVVPGSRRVTVDGLVCTDVDRVLQITRNWRHPALFCEDVVVRRVTADDIRDRLSEVSNSSGGVVVRGLTLEDWVVGGSGLGTANLPGILNFRLLWVEDLVLDRIRLEAIHTQQFHYAWHFEDVAGLSIIDCFQQGGQRGIRATRTTGITGTITMNGLTANTPHVFRQISSGAGALSVTHDASYTPVIDAADVVVTLIPA
ncbi:MAG: TIGR02217 family protein [Rhodobacteraceae bacterium]|nr:TIGR02217 family protein [Paracoccaceae bacterium]